LPVCCWLPPARQLRLRHPSMDLRQRVDVYLVLGKRKCGSRVTEIFDRAQGKETQRTARLPFDVASSSIDNVAEPDNPASRITGVSIAWRSNPFLRSPFAARFERHGRRASSERHEAESGMRVPDFHQGDLSPYGPGAAASCRLRGRSLDASRWSITSTAPYQFSRRNGKTSRNRISRRYKPPHTIKAT
jgi:hypothetical protein